MTLKRRYLGLIVLAVCTIGSAFGAPICEPGYLCFCTSPVIIDLDGTGIRLTDAVHGIKFDFFGNGKPIQIAWTAQGVRNGWLVLDRNGNGTIDSGLELFGNITPQTNCPAPNGFNALADFDKPENGGNADGIIDSRDTIFPKLRIWIDENHNGVSEPNELLTLVDAGVEALSLDYKLAMRHDRYGNTFRYRAPVQGTPNSHVGRFAYDVFLSAPPTPIHAESPNTSVPIDGAASPQSIPMEVLYSFFLRRASCDDSDSELEIKRCLLVHKSIGLSAEDQSHLPAQLKGLREQLLSMDRDIEITHRESGDEATKRGAALEKQRSNLIQTKIDNFRKGLSANGQQLFDAYIERMRSKTKFVSAKTSQSGGNPNAQ